jgi:hypothetical protein
VVRCNRLVMSSLVATLALSGFVLTASTAVSARVTTSPGGLLDDYDAAIASAGGHLWLAKTGRDRKRRVRTQVLRLAKNRWKPLPGLLRSTTDRKLELTTRATNTGRVPCVGYALRGDRATIRCFEDGSWRTMRIHRSLRSFGLAGLTERHGRLTALFSRWGPGFRTGVRVGQLRNGWIVPKGRMLRMRGQVLANLGTVTGSAPKTIDLGLEDLEGRRWIATLRRDGWHRSRRLAGLAPGPQLSGPVRTNSGVYLPIVEALFPISEPERDWALSVYRYANRVWNRVGRGPLNAGFGKAQGGIYAVGGRIWATWNELDADSSTSIGDPIPTRQFAALLGRRNAFGKASTLWSGRTISPGVSQAIGYRGKPAFLYMRRTARRRGLRATVEIGLPRR